jgi:hypothetical protein
MLVDQRAKALIGDVTAFQTAQAAPDSQKRCVAVLLRAIVSVRNRGCLDFLAPPTSIPFPFSNTQPHTSAYLLRLPALKSPGAIRI